MLLVGKARHRVVGLMGEMRPPDAPLGRGAESREVRAARQMMHESGGEDGLAGAREAGDAEAQGGLNELAGGLPERLRRGPGAGGEIGEQRARG